MNREYKHNNNIELKINDELNASIEKYAECMKLHKDEAIIKILESFFEKSIDKSDEPMLEYEYKEMIESELKVKNKTRDDLINRHYGIRVSNNEFDLLSELSQMLDISKNKILRYGIISLYKKVNGK